MREVWCYECVCRRRAMDRRSVWLIIAASRILIDECRRRSRWRVIAWLRLRIKSLLTRNRRKGKVVAWRKESLQRKRRWRRNQPCQPITPTDPTRCSTPRETATWIGMRMCKVPLFVPAVKKRCSSIGWITDAAAAVKISATAI